jgi:hypothetical protein
VAQQTQLAEYNILIADSHLSRISEVADALTSAGFHVAKVMPHTGTVSGTIDPQRAEALRQVAGVEMVVPNRTFKAL